MQLDYKIRIMAEHEGADFFGVADLSSAKDMIKDQGGSVCVKYPKAVSIGIKLPQTIVDELPNRDNPAVAVNYRHAYDITNLRLDLLTSKLGSIIQQDGHKALPVPASKRTDNKRICAVFSHKLAANLAGLGWIGKSCLLVTPEAGPRVRWATVLTDAPLIVTGEPMEVQCGECNECVEICPVSAFTGKPFRENEPREARYNAKKCEEYLYNADEDSEGTVCGLCIYICPHGKNKKE